MIRGILTLALLSLITQPCAAELIDGSFETPGVVPQGQPTSTGLWQGDPAAIVQTENGITPVDGSRMLRFDGTFPGFTINGISGEIVQLVDLSNYVLSGGSATADISASFNRVASSEADPRFTLGLATFTGNPSSYVTFETDSLTTSTVTLNSDADLLTWQTLGTSVNIPTSATYLSVQLVAFDDFNDAPPNEFKGNYADAVSLTVNAPVVPEPSSFVLFAGLLVPGLIGYVWRRGRKATA